tara:strand:- start:268 stop:747 length:480 start_codon:yes stop_codon:yes gene_type:complete
MSGIIGGGSKSGVIGERSFTGSDYFVASYTSGSGWHDISSNGVIPFNKIRYDDGGNYDTSAYKFTAPATGIYHFGCSIYTADDDATNGWTFFIDGSAPFPAGMSVSQTHAMYKENQTGDYTIAVSLDYKLNAGQYVTTNALTNSELSDYHSFWWGWRIK